MVSLEPGSPPCAIFYYGMLAKQRESLVHFDHVLDVVGLGYQLIIGRLRPYTTATNTGYDSAFFTGKDGEATHMND